jgi:hypothetical protein
MADSDWALDYSPIQLKIVFFLIGMSNNMPFKSSPFQLIMLLANVLGSSDYHANLMPRSAPLPLDLEKLGKIENQAKAGKFRIGYHFNDGFVKPTPGYEFLG